MLSKAFSFLVSILVISTVYGQNLPELSNTTAPFPTGTIQSVPPDYNTQIPLNYITTWQPKGPYRNASDVISIQRTPSEVQTSKVYTDGIGRNIQTVYNARTRGLKDYVNVHRYNNLGLETIKYKSYADVQGSANGSFKHNAFNAQTAFYTSGFEKGIQGEQVFYSQVEYENSPLSRSMKIMPPGNTWAGSNKGVSIQYLFNSQNEVRLWEITTSVNDVPVSSAYYAAGQLSKTVSIDETGKRTIRYTDKDGLLILTKVEIGTGSSADPLSHDGWLCTYYIFDDFNQSRVTISPEGVRTLKNNNWDFTLVPDVANELCYISNYDLLGRIISHKAPGASETQYVYDNRDRLVFSATGNDRQGTYTNNISKWRFILYDQRDRVIAEGSVDLALSRDDIQAYVDGLSRGIVQVTYNTPLLEILSAWNPVIDNSGICTSCTNWAIDIINYYDQYSWTSPVFGSSNIDNTFTNSGGYISSFNTAPDFAAPVIKTELTEGLFTGNKVRILGSDDFLATAMFYDESNRLIQTKRQNHMGGMDILTTQYNFEGQILRAHQYHTNYLGTPYQILTKCSFDHAGRLLSTVKNVNNAGDITVSVLEYNEVGLLKSKKLGKKRTGGGSYGSDPIEILDYTYNVRGWLNGINRGYANSAFTSEAALQSDRFFGQQIGFDYGFTSNQFNGNVAGINWKNKGSNATMSYGYSYDASNRMLKADYVNQANSAVDFSLKLGDGVNPDLAYDHNGNIKSLQQSAFFLSNSSPIDNITLSYLPNSNRLSSVSDPIMNSDIQLGDFKDLYTGSVDYDYDLNGNAKSDLNRQIQEITYNHLNLPTRIVITGKGTIEFKYDASGKKLFKKIIDNTVSPLKTTYKYYVSGLQYSREGSSYALDFIGYEDGKIRLSSYDGYSFAYDYYIKDYLGNVRSVITDEERTNIYPAATLESGNPLEPKILAVEKAYYSITESLIVNASDYQIPASVNDNGIQNPNSGYGGLQSNSSQKWLRLMGGTFKKGPYPGIGITLKVMAGDKVDIHGKSYYSEKKNPFNEDIAISTLSLLTSMLATPTNAVGGSSHFNVTSLQLDNNAATTSGLVNLFNDQSFSNSGSAKPTAYINYILFDENFNTVSAGYSQVGDQYQIKNHFSDASMQNIPVIKNGYIYIFCSNRTPVNVFFDNLQVVHKRGHLLEEAHYNPLGLRLESISSRALPSNPSQVYYQSKQYQSKELSDGTGLNWYDFEARYYDAQIGRWHVQDPAHELVNASPYSAMANNWPKYTDPDGKFLHIIIGGVVGGLINLGVKAAQGKIDSWGDGFAAFGIGAAAGAVGAATGGAAFVAAGGAAGGGGGFIAGAAAGMGGAAFASPIQGIGNAVYFNDPYSANDWGKDILIGGVTGGVVNGSLAWLNNRNPWNGDPTRFRLAGGSYRNVPPGGSSKNKVEVNDPEFSGASDDGVNFVDEFAGKKASLVSRIEANLRLYPEVIDPRTQRAIPMPAAGQKVPVANRVPWGKSERAAFIKQWIENGYGVPKGGWAEYDIHHILPREYGGTNDFLNLVPVLRKTHQELFNTFWRNYISP